MVQVTVVVIEMEIKDVIDVQVTVINPEVNLVIIFLGKRVQEVLNLIMKVGGYIGEKYH